MNFGLHLKKDVYAEFPTITMIMLVFCLMYKLFFYLRVFDNMSSMVTMIMTVIYDLRKFTLFFVVLIFFFSLVFGAMSVGNKSEDDEIVKRGKGSKKKLQSELLLLPDYEYLG